VQGIDNLLFVAGRTLCTKLGGLGCKYIIFLLLVMHTHTHLVDVNKEANRHDDAIVIRIKKRLYVVDKLIPSFSVPVVHDRCRITSTHTSCCHREKTAQIKRLFPLPPANSRVLESIRVELQCGLLARNVLWRRQRHNTVEPKFSFGHLDI